MLWVVLFIASATGAGLYFVVNTSAYRALINNLPLAQEEHSWHIITIPFLVLIISHQAHLLLWRTMLWIRRRIMPRIHARMVQHIFAYISQHAYSFYQNNLSGSISARIQGMVTCIEQFCYLPVTFTIRSGVQLLVTIAALYTIKPIFAAIFFFWTACFMLTGILFYKRSRRFSRAYAQSLSTLFGRITDNINNIQNIRLYAQAQHEQSQLKWLINDMRDAYQNRDRITIIAYSIQGVCMSAMVGSSIYFLIQSFLNHQLFVGDCIFVITAALYIAESLWMMVSQIYMAQDLIGQCQNNLSELLQPHGQTLPHKSPATFNPYSDIVFNDVHFAYHEGLSVFKGLTVTIPAGQKVGLVGLSGSGKSTFISLILRLFDVQKGSISLGEHDIRTLASHDLYSTISIAPQSHLLFHRSLRENIQYGHMDASDEEIVSISKQAYAHDFIQHIPQQYDAIVGEQGLKLSGGQRQRIILARALLKPAPILILDEATSQIDPIVERKIQTNIDALPQKKTVIIAAHRLSTLVNVDRILVFENGTITGDGAHHELLETHTHYQHLWQNYKM